MGMRPFVAGYSGLRDVFRWGALLYFQAERIAVREEEGHGVAVPSSNWMASLILPVPGDLSAMGTMT